MVLDFGLLKSGLFPESEQVGDGLGGDKQASLLAETILGQVEELTLINTVAVYEKHWYKMDNVATDGGIEDDDATVTGATYDATNFKTGTHAALFDADTEYWTITADAYWTPSAFTHCFWFRPTATPADWRAIAGMNISGNAGYGSLRMNSSLNLELWNSNESSAKITSTGGLLTLNTWHWICITQSSNSWEMYIDNASVGTSSFSFTDVSGLTLRIGARGANDRNARGQIDDFRVYNTVLTATERATIYNGGSGTANPLSSTVDVLTLLTGTGTAYIWVDDTGDLRYMSSVPTRLREGAVVGDQTA